MEAHTELGAPNAGSADVATALAGGGGAARVRLWSAVAVAGTLSVAVLLSALRVQPQVWGDPGVWLSVGARLLDGDRLYADVFDNKDPLFFYSYAAALWIGGVRGPFVLEVLWLAVAALGMALALRTLRAGTLAMVAGATVYPLALTASWYVPGATMVPALVSVALAAAVCAALIAYEALRYQNARTWIRRNRGTFTIEEARRVTPRTGRHPDIGDSA